MVSLHVCLELVRAGRHTIGRHYIGVIDRYNAAFFVVTDEASYGHTALVITKPLESTATRPLLKVRMLLIRETLPLESLMFTIFRRSIPLLMSTCETVVGAF